MRNVHANRADTLPGPIVATANELPRNHHVRRHRHWRSQLLYAATGVMLVGTETTEGADNVVTDYRNLAAELLRHADVAQPRCVPV